MSETVPSCSIRVVLRIENRLLREALFRLFRKRSDFLLVGEVAQANPPPWQTLNTVCDVLVLDSCELDWLAESRVSNGSGRTAFRTLLIGMEPDEEQFMTAVHSGVMGYLLRDASATDLVAAVRAVHHGDAVCPPHLCSTLFRFVADVVEGRSTERSPAKPELTVRQQQLIALVAKGLTNKEIASHLNLSEFTVRNHIHRILKQVDAESRSQAVETIRSYGYSISS